MSHSIRTIVIGAALAVVVVAAGVAALFVLRPADPGIAADSKAPSRVVVVFAMPDEERAVTAQLVAVVDPATGRYELQETSRTVSIPGTSYTLLRDAYPFGGAQAVAAALDGGSIKDGTAWVDVSADAWRRLVASGVDVTITTPFDTFDEETDRYAEFTAGANHVAPEDLWALVNGAAYLDAQEHRAIMTALAATSLRGLASAQPTQGIETDLTPALWDPFVGGLAGRS